MRDFLDFLMSPEGYVEVRCIKDGKVKQWFTKDRQDASDLAIKRSDEGWDAYYGVLPRLDRKGDAKHITPVTRVLWADLDAKTIGSKRQALQALVRYKLPPSVVVDSGHGYHAYWKLDAAIGFDKAKLAMVGIAKQLKGDHVYDQARILRIPGTTNWKEEGKPVPVRTVVFNTTNVLRFPDFYRQSELGLGIMEPPKPEPSPRVAVESMSMDVRASFPLAYAIPSWLDDLIKDGVPQGQRSEQAFKVMIKLAERGWSDAEILTAFERGGIGEKMREMRTGRKWFDYSMKKARTQARLPA